MISTSSLIAYIAFGVCLFYQQLHIKNFRGASQAFLSFLLIFAMSGTVTGIGFLVFCFIKFSWWTPIVLLLIGLMAQIPVTIFEKLIPPLYISLAGFIVMPVAAFVMFSFA